MLASMRVFLAILLAAAITPTHAAGEARQLAMDQGCYNCHGEPPRRNVPSFRELVARYAPYRGHLDVRSEQELVDRMHDGSLFSHVAAHERLTEEQARVLVRWLVEGAP